MTLWTRVPIRPQREREKERLAYFWQAKRHSEGSYWTQRSCRQRIELLVYAVNKAHNQWWTNARNSQQGLTQRSKQGRPAVVLWTDGEDTDEYSAKKIPLSSVKFNRAPAWEFFMQLLFHTASELKLFSSLRFYKWLTRAELRPCVLDINRIFSRSSLMILGRVKAHNRWLIFTLYMTRRATWGIIAFNEIYFHILHPLLFTQAD